jgi:hypothetical protein
VHPLSPALLIAAASASAGFPDDATGMRFVNHCGHHAHLTLATGKSSWPLPKVASCDALAAYAWAKGILEEDPAEGDIFLKYSPFQGRFVRAGIVVSVDYEYTWDGRSVYLCTVVDAGVSRGCALSPITGDRVVRWVDMEWRRHAA